MGLWNKIHKNFNNKNVMRVTLHYFLTMFSIYCVQDNYFNNLKDTTGQDASKALNLNLTSILAFPVSLTLAVIIKALNDHRIVIVLQFSLFISSLIIECCIYKKVEPDKFWAGVSAIFYNVGQGTLFTTLDFMKINSLSLCGSLHSVSIVSIGASSGQMCGLLMPIIISFFEEDKKESRQKLRFAAIFISILCILMSIFLSPETDYSLKSMDKENHIKKKKRTTRQIIASVFKLFTIPSYLIFLLGLLLQCGVQKNIKILQKDFTSTMKGTEFFANVSQFITRGLSILCYFAVIHITSEKMIFNYFLLSCLFATLRASLFVYISSQEKILKIHQCIIMLIYTVEDGFQNLSISRICNYISPQDLKIYSQGIYIGTKNSLSVAFSALISITVNDGSKTITKEIYKKIWFSMVGISSIAFVFSLLLMMLNRKR